MVAMGGAMMAGELTSFSYWLLDTFPALAKIGCEMMSKLRSGKGRHHLCRRSPIPLSSTPKSEGP